MSQSESWQTMSDTASLTSMHGRPTEGHRRDDFRQFRRCAKAAGIPPRGALKETGTGRSGGTTDPHGQRRVATAILKGQAHNLSLQGRVGRRDADSATD
jgi:hypothetical protein